MQACTIPSATQDMTHCDICDRRLTCNNSHFKCSAERNGNVHLGVFTRSGPPALSCELCRCNLGCCFPLSCWWPLALISYLSNSQSTTVIRNMFMMLTLTKVVNTDLTFVKVVLIHDSS